MSVTPPTDRTGQFMALFLQAEPRIYGYIRSQVLQRADAEDILQETAAVLWSKFAEFTPGSDFLAWACTVARFKVQHYHRARGRNRLLLTQEFLDAVADTSEAMNHEVRDLDAALANCMERLKDAERDVMQRSYAGNATVRAIAAELDRPVGTVKDILARARRNLYQCLRHSLQRGTQP